MSYIVIPVYNFTCDYIGPGGGQCPQSVEYVPVDNDNPNSPLLRNAHRQLRTDGWTAEKTIDGWEHLCPGHSPDKPRVNGTQRPADQLAERCMDVIDKAVTDGILPG